MKVVIPYTPQSYQMAWHQNPTRFLVAVCGRQIGKTTAAVNELVKRALQNPSTRNWYVSGTFKQSKRNVWDELKKFIPKELGATFNETELKVVFPNLSKIELIGVESADSLRGAVVHFMILDEYADFQREVWEKILAPMMSTTKGDVWFIGTPKGMGNDFYDKFHSGDESVTTYELPSCTLSDGPDWQAREVVSVLSKYVDLEVIQQAKRTSAPDSFRQEFLAKFTKPEGTVYSEWDMKHYKAVNYNPDLPVHISFDFGVNDPTAIIWIQPYAGEFRVIDYYEKSDANIDHFVQVIKSKPYHEAELITGDDAGRQRTLTTGTSPIELLAKSGLYVRTKPGVKIPERIAATHRIIPSLYIDHTLPRLRDCILNYRYPTNDENRSKMNTSREIPIHDEFSHGATALEFYAINSTDFGGKVPVIIGYKKGLGNSDVPIYAFE